MLRGREYGNSLDNLHSQLLIENVENVHNVDDVAVVCGVGLCVIRLADCLGVNVLSLLEPNLLHRPLFPGSQSFCPDRENFRLYDGVSRAT
mmetsp:Transcript_106636/g.209115  ORF Transcript_106636/g.209115 Transcript_106636/m.209115 type:complete len:91 (+) Transcript_106636:144-416(+)